MDCKNVGYKLLFRTPVFILGKRVERIYKQSHQMVIELAEIQYVPKKECFAKFFNKNIEIFQHKINISTGSITIVDQENCLTLNVQKTGFFIKQ